jgi:hypothetical protein
MDYKAKYKIPSEQKLQDFVGNYVGEFNSPETRSKLFTEIMTLFEDKSFVIKDATTDSESKEGTSTLEVYYDEVCYTFNISKAGVVETE